MHVCCVHRTYLFKYLPLLTFNFLNLNFGSHSYSSQGTDQLPAGALITYIQKGLQYVEIESHINDDGSEVICDEQFTILKPHTCVVKDTKRLFDPYEPVVADYGVFEIEDDEYTLLNAHEAMVRLD